MIRRLAGSVDQDLHVTECFPENDQNLGVILFKTREVRLHREVIPLVAPELCFQFVDHRADLTVLSIVGPINQDGRFQRVYEALELCAAQFLLKLDTAKLLQDGFPAFYFCFPLLPFI